MILLPGDVMLYRPSSLYGRIIAIKTWHRVSHCECHVGDGESVASRDRIGVNRYPVRTKDLAYVLRPTVPFDLPAALRWFETVKGQPYGWLDLLAFIGVKKDGRGMVCSPFCTSFLRAGGVPIFNQEPPNAIAPFQFLTSELLKDVTETVSA